MKNMRRYLAVIFSAIFFISVIFTGCGNGINVGDFFSGDQTEESAEIRIAVESMETLNPAISKQEDCYQISKLIYSGLFYLDEQLIPQVDLAKSFVYSEDRSSVDITLRDDVLWHDGEHFTADDVVFSVQAYLALAETGTTIYSEYVRNIRSVHATGDYTVRITFGQDAAVGMENLIFPILPKHQFSSVRALQNAAADFEPIGTGKYKVESYNALTQLVLAANEKYYGTPAENRLVFQILPDRNDGVNLTKVQDVMLLFNNEYERNTLLANRNLSIKSFPSNVTELVIFNCSRPVLSEKSVRQALSYLIDTEKILKDIYYQNGILTDSFLFNGFFGAENQGDLYEKDVERAKELLSSAGYRDRDTDGYLEDTDGNELVFVLLVNQEDVFKVATANSIKNDIEQCGILVNIDFAEKDRYSEKLSAHDFDLAVASCSVNERHDLRSLLHSEYNNIASYENNMVDTLTTELVSGYNTREKAELVLRLKGILADEIPYYPLFCKTYGAIYVPNLTGSLEPVFHDFYRNAAEWRCMKKIQNN